MCPLLTWRSNVSRYLHKRTHKPPVNFMNKSVAHHVAKWDFNPSVGDSVLTANPITRAQAQWRAVFFAVGCCFCFHVCLFLITVIAKKNLPPNQREREEKNPTISKNIQSWTSMKMKEKNNPAASVHGYTVCHLVVYDKNSISCNNKPGFPSLQY